MRKWPLIVILLAGTITLATGQVVVSGGIATYGEPQVQGFPSYVPLITTPTTNLNVTAPAQVGASNATPGLVAGATNSTLSSLAPVAGSVLATAPYPASVPPMSSAEEYEAQVAMQDQFGEQQGDGWPRPILNVGPGGLPSAYNVQPGQPSLAELAAQVGMNKSQVGHVYTNEDITRMDQQSPPQMINVPPGTHGISIVPLGPHSGHDGVGPATQVPVVPENQVEP